MSGVAAAVGGAAVLGYIASDNASSRAAGAMTSAADSANATQLAMFQQQRQDLTPWRQAGEGALNNIQQNQNDYFNRDFTMADFQADPGYQFRMDQGTKALQQSAAARGSLNSGGTLKSLTRYSQGVASDEYQNAYNRFNSDRDRRYNRLASLAGIGQTANGQLAAAGTNYANNVSGNQMAVGNTNAALAMSQGNNINNLLSNGTNTWMNYQMMNRAFPQQSATPTTAPTSSYGSPSMLGANTQFQTAY